MDCKMDADSDNKEECLLPLDQASTDHKLQSCQNVAMSISSEPLPSLSDTADCIARFKRAFYENLTTIRKLQMQQIHSGNTIIHCFSQFIVYYEMWMGFIFAFCLLLFPLHVAFSSAKTTTLLYLKLCMDTICLIDIIIRFRTACVNFKEKRIITQPRQIAMRYLKTFFLPDVLSTIPDPHSFIRNSSTSYLNVVMLLCLLKLCRITTVYEYTTRSARYLRLDRPILRVFLTTFFFLLFCHWSACSIYMLPKLRVTITGRIHQDSWIIKEKLYEEMLITQYIHSMYKATAYLLAIKQSPLKELTIEEKLLACGLYIIGKIIIFYFTVVAVGRFLSFWSLESKYCEIIEELEGFIRRKRLTPATRNRILQYYNYKFNRSYFKENTIKNILSERLRHQITKHILHSFISNVDIFRGISDETIKRVINHLRLEVFLPHDIIIKAGTLGDVMYFLRSGTVGVNTPSGKEVCHLQDGAYFGEIALLSKDQKRTAQVFAIEICEVYKLDKKIFNTYLRANTALMDKMTREANLRAEMTKIYDDINLRNFRF